MIELPGNGTGRHDCAVGRGTGGDIAAAFVAASATAGSQHQGQGCRCQRNVQGDLETFIFHHQHSLLRGFKLPIICWLMIRSSIVEVVPDGSVCCIWGTVAGPRRCGHTTVLLRPCSPYTDSVQERLQGQGVGVSACETCNEVMLAGLGTL